MIDDRPHAPLERHVRGQDGERQHRTHDTDAILQERLSERSSTSDSNSNAQPKMTAALP